MVVKWNFTDLSTSDTQDFLINPNEGGEVELAKNLNTQATVAVDGKTVIFEGAPVVPVISFSGTILDEDQYDMFRSWFFVNHQLQLTNDLGETLVIYITKFSPKRVRSSTVPWKMTYTVEALIMDWPS